MNQGELDLWNKTILESERFVVMPSLGSLVEGWLLIVPRFHVLSAAELPIRDLSELELVKTEVRQLLEAEYGKVTFFEHGPSGPRRLAGCGVDHAHVHAVPGIRTLSEAAIPFLPDSSQFRPGSLEDCRAALRKGLDYLYVEDSHGLVSVAESASFGSQTFRKAIAAQLGREDQYDWKAYPEERTIEKTWARLGTRRVSHEAVFA